jgi:hypothetical protein
MGERKVGFFPSPGAAAHLATAVVGLLPSEHNPLNKIPCSSPLFSSCTFSAMTANTPERCRVYMCICGANMIHYL